MAIFIPAGLKSPYVLGILGLSTSLVFGLGAGQIYEESNPTVDKQLSRDGYSYSPVEAPNEEKPKNKKFSWSGGGCVKRLFPGSGVKYEEFSPGSGTSTAFSSTEPLASTYDVGNFTTCAIMEIRPISPERSSEVTLNNRIYFKSEVVVKGQDRGGIMGNGISTLTTDKNHPQLAFIYKLLELKKDNNKWTIYRGWGWENYQVSGNFSNYNFVVVPPLYKDKGFPQGNPRSYKDHTPFEKKVGSGIGELDEKTGSTDLLGSISVYVNSVNESEFWGSNGEFNVAGAGYTSAQYFYVQDKGWQFVSINGKNISSELKAWYAPFKGKKIKGTDLNTRCYSGSGQRNKNVTPEEEALRNLCYRSTKV